jgi:hypothetical protein
MVKNFIRQKVGRKPLFPPKNNSEDQARTFLTYAPTGAQTLLIHVEKGGEGYIWVI